jgi:hypothetical protein
VATEIWELRVTGFTGSEPNQSVQHFKAEDVAVSDTAHVGYDLITSWQTNVQAKWLALNANDYFLDELQARRVDPIGSAVAHVAYAYRATHGTFGTQSHASQTCPCLTLLPPMGIKSAGKIFLPSDPGGFIIDSAFQAAAQTALTNWFNAASANFGTGSITWRQCIWSRKTRIGSVVQRAQFSPVIGFIERRRVYFGRSTTKKKPHV